MEYYQYFRLKGPPFQPASPHGPVYFSPTHLQGMATLESGLTGELSGLTLLTGEAGAGKTTLIYSMLQRDSKRVRIAHIDDPKLSFLEMMQVILTQLNLYSAGSTKLDYLNVLDHLLELHGTAERIAIVIDESQVLTFDVLEELRLLSNRGQRNGLQLILVGQPELAERLKQPELRQLNQRISSRGVLSPLNSEQAAKYVECRLSAQGGSCAAIFEPHALNSLLRRSDGIPRKINMLCHTAMQAAFYAGDKKVTVKVAKKVAADYQDSVGIKKQGSGSRPLGMPTLLIGTAIAALLLLAFVYPIWSDWVLSRSDPSGVAMEQTAQPVKTALQVQTGEEPRLDEHPNSAAKAKAVASAESPPLPVRTSFVPGSPSSAVSKNDGAAAATASGVAVNAGVQKENSMPAAPSGRRQITVRYGDTLELIAIRYFGSKAGINEIIQANPQLTNINQLRVGEMIYIPVGVPAKAASPDENTSTWSVSNVEESHDH
jgi:type II secretory pathway predicted ATPase ExeA/phage tail protein X